MANVTLPEIVTAVHNKMATAVVEGRTMNYNELPEGLDRADLPALYTYPNLNMTVSDESGTDRFTFQAGVRSKRFEIITDALASVRSHVGQDMSRAVDLADALVDVLETVNDPPYFGLLDSDGGNAIKAFQWRIERVTLVLGSIQFAGLRVTNAVWVF
jgi:hypothetical protein